MLMGEREQWSRMHAMQACNQEAPGDACGAVYVGVLARHRQAGEGGVKIGDMGEALDELFETHALGA
jgi:hypothetical protein